MVEAGAESMAGAERMAGSGAAVRRRNRERYRGLSGFDGYEYGYYESYRRPGPDRYGRDGAYGSCGAGATGYA